MARVRNGAACGSVILLVFSLARVAGAEVAAVDTVPAPATSARAPEAEQSPASQTPASEPLAPPTAVPPAPPQAPPTTPQPAPPTGTGFQQSAPPPGYGYAPNRYWGPPPPERVRTWYGWQTLLVDGLSISLLAAGSGGEGALVGFGTFGYFFAAPIVHWAHGNVGKGFGSLGIRAGGAVVAVLGLVSCLGGAFGDGGSSNGNGGCYVALLGGAIMVAAIPIDAAALAYDEPAESTTSLRSLHDLAIVPVFGPARGFGAFEARSRSGDLEARPSKQGMQGGFLISAKF